LSTTPATSMPGTCGPECPASRQATRTKRRVRRVYRDGVDPNANLFWAWLGLWEVNDREDLWGAELSQSDRLHSSPFPRLRRRLLGPTSFFWA
jgi:hypothetical protein